MDTSSTRNGYGEKIQKRFALIDLSSRKLFPIFFLNLHYFHIEIVRFSKSHGKINFALQKEGDILKACRIRAGRPKTVALGCLFQGELFVEVGATEVGEISAWTSIQPICWTTIVNNSFL